MKKFNYLLSLLFAIAFNINAQQLSEKEFQQNGIGQSGVAQCNGDPIFRVNISNAFKKFTYTSLQLVPYKQYITGFNIIGKPPQMTAEAGFGNKKFNWTPTEDFKSGDKRILHVQPVIDPQAADTVTNTCPSFIIELPLVRDLAPKVLVKEQELRIPVNGGNIIKKYNLLGGSTGENLNVFEHDDEEELNIIWIQQHQKFDNNIENGILTFRHIGAVPTENEFTIKLKAKDHLNQESEVVIIKCIIVANNPQSEPIWSLRDGNNEIIWSEEIVEGQKVVVKPFKAINPADGKSCKIEPTTTIKGNYEIKDESFIWTPSYDVVDARWGQAKQTIRLPFTAKNPANVSSNSTLVIKVGNSTKLVNQAKYETAISNFQKAEKAFIEDVQKPLCYIRYASEKVARQNKDIESVKSAYGEIDAVFSITAVANPIAVGVYKGLGLLITTLKGIGGNKANRIADKATQLNMEIEQYKKLSAQFTQKQATLKEFKTREQTEELLNLSVQLVNAIENFKASKSNYTTVAAIFGKRVERRMQGHCK